MRFVREQLRYPIEARDAGLQGTVYLGFTVDTNGEVIQEKLLFDIGQGCGEAALRVAHSLPHFEPARKAGKPVRVRLELPVHFQLNDDDADVAAEYSLAWGGLKSGPVSRKALRANRDAPVYVRNSRGDNLPLDELVIRYERNNRIREAQSRDEISPDQRKVIERARKGGILTVAAVIQLKGEFVLVEREYEVID